jgi:DUF4097 and DUF4098 domain-containing protein YvlB
MKKIVPVVLLLGAALLAAPAWATDEVRSIDERRPLKADARVSVSNVAGLIQVEAWDRKELHLTGTLASEVEKLEITGSESSLKIEVKLPERTRNVEASELRLKVPAGITLDADGVSADVKVTGLSGPIEAKSVSGDVRIDVASKKVKASTVSGDVTVHAPSATDTRAASVSGDVDIRAASGEVRGESVSGDVTVQAGEMKRLDLESVSGDLEVDGELTRDSEVSVETLSGSVVLLLSKLPDIELDMETFSGELESAWSPRPASGVKEFHRDGEGRGRIKLNSFSGDIELKKK